MLSNLCSQWFASDNMFFKTEKSVRTSSKADREFRKNLEEKQHREAIAKYPELADQTWLRAFWAAMGGASYRQRRPSTKKENAVENALLFVMMMIPFVSGIYLMRSTLCVLPLTLVMSFVAWHFIRH